MQGSQFAGDKGSLLFTAKTNVCFIEQARPSQYTTMNRDDHDENTEPRPKRKCRRLRK